MSASVFRRGIGVGIKASAFSLATMLSRPGLHRVSTLAREALQRQNPCLCAALRSFSRRESTTAYSTSAQHGASSSVPSDSLFSQHNSPWDKIFEGVNDSTPSRVGERKDGPLARNSPTRPQQLPRSQSMTAREKNAFQDMFDIVFSGASELKDMKDPSKVTMFTPVSGVGATHQSREMADLFNRLRRNVKRLRWTSEIDEELDRKREEIELCDKDVQLLKWATNEVFTPQQSTGTPAKGQNAPAYNNQLYPHIIASLIRAFRDKFHDPNLALAIFNHAKNLSIYSYVFGCTTPAYNELIETYWFCFRDLKSILDALEEMKVNGVEADNRTRRIVEIIRREAPSMRLMEEEDYFGNGQDRVMHILSQIELLVKKPYAPVRRNGTRRREKTWSEDWKNGTDESFLNTRDGEDWSWGSWGSSKLA